MRKESPCDGNMRFPDRCHTHITVEHMEKTYSNGGPRGEAKEKGETTRETVRGSMIPRRMSNGSGIRFSVGVADAAICPTWHAQTQRIEGDA